MRMPNIKKASSVQYTKASEIKVTKIKSYATVELEHYLDPSDEKAKTNYIKQVEKLIRASLEYRGLIKFLREEVDMTQCAYFYKVNTGMKGVKIEIHHAPFTLYDLTLIVLNRHIGEEHEANPFRIAEEVMRIHYEGKVGLIPLSNTVHELVHSDEPKVRVPIHYVFGDIVSFYEEYHLYMEDDQKAKLARSLAESEEVKTIPDVLQRKFEYLQIEGMELPLVK